MSVQGGTCDRSVSETGSPASKSVDVDLQAAGRTQLGDHKERFVGVKVVTDAFELPIDPEPKERRRTEHDIVGARLSGQAFSLARNCRTSRRAGPAGNWAAGGGDGITPGTDQGSYSNCDGDENNSHQRSEGPHSINYRKHTHPEALAGPDTVKGREPGSSSREGLGSQSRRAFPEGHGWTIAKTAVGFANGAVSA